MPDMPDMFDRLLLMSGKELRLSHAMFDTHKMSNKENKNDH